MTSDALFTSQDQADYDHEWPVACGQEEKLGGSRNKEGIEFQGHLFSIRSIALIALSIKLGTVVHAFNPSIRERRQEVDLCKFEARFICIYIGSSRPISKQSHG